MFKYMFERIFFFWSFFRTTKMTHQNNTATIIQNFFDGGNCSTHSCIISYFRNFFIKRNIEVNTNQCFFISEVVVREFAHKNVLKNKPQSALRYRRKRKGICLLCEPCEISAFFAVEYVEELVAVQVSDTTKYHSRTSA